MKVLSIKEPWASLVKEKVKLIETRSWKTNYRGVLYIHASKKELTKKDFKQFEKQLKLLLDNNFKYGHIIAKCELVDCQLMTEELIQKIKENNNEYICGTYQIGRYAWFLENIEPLDKPIAVNGQLGIWNYKN